MAGEIQSWLIEKFAAVDNEDGSQIETLFRAGAVVCARLLRIHGNEGKYALGAQEQIGPYRVDFILEAYGVEVVVEVDGHEFHERTKEQARRDKARDRYLTANGYAVIRFAGSEVWANPFKCADEAFAIARAVSITRGGK